MKGSFALVFQSAWATCTFYNVLHDWSRGQKNEQQNNINAPTPKKKINTAAGYIKKGPMKMELLKGVGLLVQRVMVPR